MKSITRLLPFLLLGTLLLAVTGCNSKSMAPQMSAASVQFKVGDDPADQALAFEITIKSVMLNSSTGSTPNVLSAPVDIELTHLAGTFEPLGLANVSPGTYNSASITLGPAELKFLDPNTQTVKEQQFPATAGAVTVTFTQPIVVGSTPTIVNIDFNLGMALTFNGTNFTFDPTKITVSQVSIGAENGQGPEDGKMEDLSGTVTGISGTLPGGSFTISTDEADSSLMFNTDSNTIFEPSAAAVMVNTIVEVDATTQADGSFLAKKVKAEVENDGQGGEMRDQLEVEGVVTTRTPAPPSPVTSFAIVVQDEASPGTVMPTPGNTMTVTVGGGTNFRVKLDNLPAGFTFDATSLNVAQRIEADTETPDTSMITAKTVTLKKQALTGTVSGLSGNNFTLMVDTSSFFASLTGKTTVAVTTQPGTTINGSLTNAAKARVRGLLFFDPVGGTYSLLATQIDINP
jgi:Domain of unknown function (DUF5666)/Domain of unknown function (DUF4382)